jgi:hypothetical protein
MRAAVSSTSISSDPVMRISMVRETTSGTGGNRKCGKTHDSACQPAASTSMLTAACRKRNVRELVISAACHR